MRDIFQPTMPNLSICELIDISYRRLKFLVKSNAPALVIRLERAILNKRLEALGDPPRDSLHPQGL